MDAELKKQKKAEYNRNFREKQKQQQKEQPQEIPPEEPKEIPQELPVIPLPEVKPKKKQPKKTPNVNIEEIINEPDEDIVEFSMDDINKLIEKEIDKRMTAKTQPPAKKSKEVTKEKPAEDETFFFTEIKKQMKTMIIQNTIPISIALMLKIGSLFLPKSTPVQQVSYPQNSQPMPIPQQQQQSVPRFVNIPMPNFSPAVGL